MAGTGMGSPAPSHPESARPLDLVISSVRAVATDVISPFGAMPAGAAACCCGPTAVLDAALAIGEGTRPDIPVRLERFVARPASAGLRDEGFEVELARSGVAVAVPPGVSVLDAVRSEIPGVMSSCEQGICSACETAVLDGVPDHRDSVLTPRERAANNYMMICVSRAPDPPAGP